MGMTSMWREAPENDKDGNPVPGPFSARRVLAFLSFIVSAGAGILAIIEKTPNWYVFIPCGIFAVLSLSMLILTSVTDVQTIIAVWRSAQK
jgi:hypothetical protein